MPRSDGLSNSEGVVADALVEAANAFGALPCEHPCDPREFFDAIHRCQQLLALRIARRAYPKGWPTRVDGPMTNAGGARGAAG